MSIYKKVCSIFIALVMLLGLASCSNVKIDDPVTLDNVNMSPGNCCLGFIQALYENDEELFNTCRQPLTMYENDELVEDDSFEQYRAILDEEYEYIGSKFIEARPCDENFGFDYADIRNSISICNGIEEKDIDEIQLVDIKTFFKDGSKTKSIEYYSVVYRSSDKWYFFILADVTAKTANK